MQKRYIKSLSHCYFECKYHIVWTPKYRGKILVNDYVKQELTRILNLICKWKDWEILELNLNIDHIHLVLIIPPKYSVSYVMSVVKGKSSNWVKKTNKKIKELCDKGSLWARGYFVSTVGVNEYMIRRYVRYQEKHNQVDTPSLFDL